MVGGHIVEWELLQQLYEFNLLPCQSSKTPIRVGNMGASCKESVSSPIKHTPEIAIFQSFYLYFQGKWYKNKQTAVSCT